jgi:hypothetical protein
MRAASSSADEEIEALADLLVSFPLKCELKVYGVVYCGDPPYMPAFGFVTCDRDVGVKCLSVHLK